MLTVIGASSQKYSDHRFFESTSALSVLEVVCPGLKPF